LIVIDIIIHRVLPFLLVGVSALLVYGNASNARAGLFDRPQEETDLQNAEPIVLSIQTALNEALVNDLGIQVERMNPDLRFNEITIEKGEFDPQLSANLSHRLSITPRSVSVIETFFSRNDTKNAQTEYSMGVEQRLFTGTQYGLHWTNRRSRDSFQSVNPIFRSAVSIDITQPLLNGFGTAIHQTEIKIAQNNFTISREVFALRTMDLLQEVQDVYWDLVFQRRNLRVQQQSLRAAFDLLEINRAKVQEGLLAPVEVLVAEAEAAAREEMVLVAWKGLRDAEDRLRRLIRPRDLESLKEIRIIPTDEPKQDKYEVDLKTSIETALTQRPDLKEARLNVKNQRLALLVAENQLLPSLDLQGSAGLNGLGENLGNDFEQVGSGDFYSWQAGVAFSIPIGNRTGRGNLAKQSVGADKARIELSDLTKGVVVEVKEAVRRVTTDWKRIETTRRAKLLAEKKLEVETERYNVGLATTHEVLEFQDDLANAQVSELEAILDYNRSLVNLDRVKGTILISNDVVLNEY
jgi:outer membrane protein TolC